MANGYLIRNGAGMTNVSFVANPTVGSRIWISSKQYTTIAYGNTYNAAYRYGTGIGDIRYQNYSIAAPGSKTFTSSGTFTVPNGVTQIRVLCVGGGGGGGATAHAQARSRHGDSWIDTNEGFVDGGGGGGGGGYVTNTTMNVTPGQQISVTIGAGGTGPQMTDYYYYPYENDFRYSEWERGTAGGNGGTTSCGSVTAAGGRGGGAGTGPESPAGVNVWSSTGGAGGAGYGNGGRGGNSGQSDDTATANTNRNGGNGGDGYNYNGTTYSGGGAGASGGYQNFGFETSYHAGKSGSPGGRGSVIGESAAANTGGGMGATGLHYDRYTVISEQGTVETGRTRVSQVTTTGGSGICIISWG